MTITLNDLIPLLPLLVAIFTVVIAMVAVGIKRSYVLAALITVCGLAVTAFCAFWLLPGANFQVTPLLIIDEYSLFFIGYMFCLSDDGIQMALLGTVHKFETSTGMSNSSVLTSHSNLTFLWITLVIHCA